MNWEQADQDKALGFVQWKQQSCGHCGTIPEAWFDEDGVPLEPEDYPYELTSRRCHGCVIMAEEQERLTKAKEKGVFLFFRKIFQKGSR